MDAFHEWKSGTETRAATAHSSASSTPPRIDPAVAALGQSLGEEHELPAAPAPLRTT